MAAETIEIILRDENFRGVDMLRWNFSVIDISVRNIDFGETIEIAHQLIRMVVGKPESWHPNLQPGSQRDWRLEKTKEPGRLNFFSFTVERRRRRRLVILVVLSNK